MGPEAREAPCDTQEPEGWLFTVTPWKAALLGPFVDFTGLGAILPLLPFFVRDTGADTFWIGAILSAQYTAVVIGSAFWGRMADFVGVRKVYLLLLVLDVIFFTLSAFCTTVESLLICRFFAGFSAIMPLGTAWISATCPPEKINTAFSFLVPSVLGGFICGSAIGATAGQLKTGIGMGDGGWFAAVMVSTLLVCVVLFIILCGTAPPPVRKAEDEKVVPEGVKDATCTVSFFACCLTSFLGANEGGAMMVMISMVLATDGPDGFSYSQSQVSGVFVTLASVLLFSSVIFSAFLDKRTHALQRIVLLGFATVSITLLITLMMASWQSEGLWRHGDLMFVGSVISLFFFQCVMGPTAMAIASLVASSKAKNADGTIMGIQQMFMNAGQAIGPIIGGSLYTINMYAPFLYLFSFECIALVVNIYVFRQAHKDGEVERQLFNVRRSMLGLTTTASLPTSQPANVAQKVAASDSQVQGNDAITPVDKVAKLADSMWDEAYI